MLRNTEISYGSIAKFFHWLIAILVIAALVIGTYMVGLSDKDPIKGPIYGFHKATGAVILFLVILRILWRWTNEIPRLPLDMRPILKKTARFVHYSLYIMLVLTPITGLIMSIYGGHSVSIYGFFTIPAVTTGPTPIAGLTHTIHINLIYFWLAFLTAHVGGGLYHYFIRKDNILQRMLPWGT